MILFDIAFDALDLFAYQASSGRVDNISDRFTNHRIRHLLEHSTGDALNEVVVRYGAGTRDERWPWWAAIGGPFCGEKCAEGVGQ